ncbi:hypothetical protein NB689_000206 [Xanthomonas sacchari]|uniref:hypothetical protein n=1 Tax=Xanthomonas sacchari TaxID=56458 RepID=UPI00224C8A3A|nr:hypothetical protein [Xanthomonas sacchari]MCW0403790.1 hypothetical protein [Xanthomonas sacchari]MCW0414452.1 hypothetical protein [Xanthomonas sacchari]
MANYLTPLRRIAEAVSARLCYDYLCFKGPLFDESYLSHSVSDIICSFYDPNTVVIRKNHKHAGLGQHAKPKGRKPEIDYVGMDLKSNEAILAIEAKWAGSSHCTAENILWDLVRLKILKNLYPRSSCGLLIAGHKSAVDKVFSHKFFAYRTQHPLNRSFNKRKNFCLINNSDHQPFINKQLEDWKKTYPDLIVPANLKTQLEESSISANPSSRFIARCWRVE